MRRASTKWKGFTLIELIASIAIFAFIMLGLSNMLGETTRLSTKVKERQSSVLAAQVSLDRLQRELPMSFYDPALQKQSRFLLTSQLGAPELVFSFIDSPIRSLFVPRSGGLKMVRYYFEKHPESGTMNLFRTEQAITSSKEIRQEEGRLVATGIVDLKIEAYNRQNDQWVETWDDTDQFTRGRAPEAVRLLMRVTDPDLPKDQQSQRMLTYATTFRMLIPRQNRRGP
jgi:prepilin-type N-terminal cleavage/methylation domain-containing protein